MPESKETPGEEKLQGVSAGAAPADSRETPVTPEPLLPSSPEGSEDAQTLPSPPRETAFAPSNTQNMPADPVGNWEDFPLEDDDAPLDAPSAVPSRNAPPVLMKESGQKRPALAVCALVLVFLLLGAAGLHYFNVFPISAFTMVGFMPRGVTADDVFPGLSHASPSASPSESPKAPPVNPLTLTAELLPWPQTARREGLSPIPPSAEALYEHFEQYETNDGSGVIDSHTFQGFMVSVLYENFGSRALGEPLEIGQIASGLLRRLPELLNTDGIRDWYGSQMAYEDMERLVHELTGGTLTPLLDMIAAGEIPGLVFESNTFYWDQLQNEGYFSRGFVSEDGERMEATLFWYNTDGSLGRSAWAFDGSSAGEGAFLPILPRKIWRYHTMFMAVGASSALPATETETYSPANATDALVETAWSGSEEGNGIFEALYLKGDRPRAVSAVTVRGGNHTSEELYRAHSRPRALLIEFGDGQSVEMLLEDTFASQTIWLDAADPPVTDFITVSILDVYVGAVYPDSPISEIVIT